MKQYIIISAMAFVLLCSCTKKTPPHFDHYFVDVVVDLTDHRQVYPLAEYIIPLFNLSKEENSEASFKLCPVTDRELNPDIEFHLPTGEETENDNRDDDPDLRKKVIVQFFSDIRSSLKNFTKKANEDSAYTHSECFKIIAAELQNIVNKKSDKSVMLVYSDLQENSDFFNCYSKADQKLLFATPGKVQSIFEKAQLLPSSLKNITVCFIYDPVSRDDDTAFNAMLKVYKKMLCSRGAKIMVSADNPKYLQL